MSVFDKELTINGKAVRSPEQQVWKNMKDIEELKENIKPEYTTSASLTSSSVSVAIASTNAPEGTTEGWLLTQDGLKFKITGGDETNLLLEYYADLKGPQGEDGAAVNIDDNTTSATKCWSSQKVNNELSDIVNDYVDKGTYYTNTQPTDDTTIDSSALLNKNGYVPIQVNDLIIYIDGNNNPTSIYMVYSISGSTLTVVKLGDYAKGNQLYQHNVYFKKVGTNSTVYFQFQLTNNIPTHMNFNQFRDYIYENRVIGWGGTSLTSLQPYFTSYPYGSTTKSYNIYSGSYYSTSGSVLTDLTTEPTNYTLEDDVKPL